MKSLFLLTAVAYVAVLPLSQTPSGTAANSRCSLTREQAPEIRGVRLGMTAEQLQKLFPEEMNRQVIIDAVSASTQAENYGAGSFDLRPQRATDNPQLAGVNYITVRMVDQRVTSFSVSYAGPEWTNAGQFVARLSEGLRLPDSGWELGEESGLLKCDGFRIDANIARGSTESWVRVIDTVTPRIVDERREAAKEKVRQAFKP